MAVQTSYRQQERRQGQLGLLICLPGLLGQIPGPCHRLIMYYCCWQALHPWPRTIDCGEYTMPWLVAFFERDCFSTAENSLLVDTFWKGLCR